MSLHLLFHSHLEDSSKLLEGRLLLIESNNLEIVDTFRAASGSVGWQEPDEVNKVGRGAIPEQGAVGIQHYGVLTEPLDSRNVKGVEGNFYTITPRRVSVNGVTRGDFGIHKDANVPGSAGCIVLTTAVGWEAFQQYMRQLRGKGLYQVPLLVSYSK